MLALNKIETAATSARLAGHYVRSVWIAALYKPAHVVATVVWSMPVTWSEPVTDQPGVTKTYTARPSDTTLLLGTASAPAVEAEILSAAWALGAWDVRRNESAPLKNPDEWDKSQHGLAGHFGFGSYAIDGQPISSGDCADLWMIQQAAREGHVHWHFVPLALSSPEMRRRWSTKDRTLADGACTRGARVITPHPLAGKQAHGHGHEHIYQLGRAPHGNRSKSSNDRRG